MFNLNQNSKGVKMKKVFVFAVVSLFFVTTAFAAPFAPTTMTLEAPASIQYAFDGGTLEIPVTVTGTPANMVFCVFTKDQGESVENAVSGFLGWHTVNKIDTAIYIGTNISMAVGSDVITWDGMDADGNAVPEGDYYYYLFAYDNQNFKVPVIDGTVADLGGWDVNNFVTHDFEGNPLPQPIVYMAAQNLTPEEGAPSASQNDEGPVSRRRWVIGNDPADATLLETTGMISYTQHAKLQPSPYESDMFFVLCTTNTPSASVRKYNWVPNGMGELQTDWGEDGMVNYNMSSGVGWWAQLQGFEYIGDDTLMGTNTDHSGESFEAELVLVDALEGLESRRIDLSEWWIDLEDGENNGQQASGPNQFAFVDGNLVMGAHSTCMNQMIAPMAGEDPEEWNRWINSNGDYVGDHNYEETAANPWVCNDYMVGPYKYHMGMDSNLFSVFPCYDMGAVSFGLYAPDGTGIGYFAYSGETANLKRDSQFIDYGSMYDGIYTDNDSAGEGADGFFYVAQDSFKGIITSGVGVADAAPAAFEVAQNSPNPFNPTTTISFTLANAGTVSVDVYNVAGQNVDTIVNEFLDSGSHSVVWDASDFSAGVYFYTVKGGDFSKTMKMTLIK